MPKICDNTSVGQIVRKGDEIALIKRENYPQAIALPAGHCDGDPFVKAAAKESLEEVGIAIVRNKLVWEGRILNSCKREGGTFHDWQVFEAEEWSGELKSGSDAREAFWATPEKLRQFVSRTEYFVKKFGIPYVQVGDLTRKVFGDPASPVTDPEWAADPGLEFVWYFILKQAQII